MDALNDVPTCNGLPNTVPGLAAKFAALARSSAVQFAGRPNMVGSSMSVWRCTWSASNASIRATQLHSSPNQAGKNIPFKSDKLLPGGKQLVKARVSHRLVMSMRSR